MTVTHYILAHSYNLLFNAVKLFNCGNENLNFIPSAIFLVNVALLLFVIFSYQPQLITPLQVTLRLNWNYSLILVVKSIGFFWLLVIHLAGYLASWFAPDDLEQISLKSEKIKLIICTLIALVPLVTSFYLYMKFKMHQSLVLEFEEFVRSLDLRRTELGYVDRIQDIREIDRKMLGDTIFRSCPNISL